MLYVVCCFGGREFPDRRAFGRAHGPLYVVRCMLFWGAGVSRPSGFRAGARPVVCCTLYAVLGGGSFPTVGLSGGRTARCMLYVVCCFGGREFPDRRAFGRAH